MGHAQSGSEIQLETVIEFAADLHRKAILDPEALFGVFPPDEVAGWAKDWFLKFEASGGMLDGVKIKNPLASLTAWLRACARRQSKRFKELNRLAITDPSDAEPPFGLASP